MSDSEAIIDHLEKEIPKLAQAAGKIAYLNALANGESVLEAINGSLYRTFPDGRREFIKKLPPGVKATYGQKFELR